MKKMKKLLVVFIIMFFIILTGCQKDVNKNDDIKGDNKVKFSYITSNNANTVALDTEGNVWTMYNNSKPTKVEINAKIIQIDAGEHYTVALDTEGNVWTWGLNNSGQLGDGTTEKRDIPKIVFNNASMISAGQNAVFVITKDNELYSWGSGAYHKLPKDNSSDVDNYLSPTKYDSNIKFKYVECGKSNGGVAIDVDDNRYIWGTYNYAAGVESKQLGFDTSVSPMIVKKVENDTIKFKQIYMHNNLTYAIDDNGYLYAAGSKDKEIGFEHDDIIAKYTQIAKNVKFKDVCSQAKYSLALDEDGNIWAWGEKNDITSKESKEPFKLTDDKKYIGISFNNFSNKVAYAIDEDGILYTWGENLGSTLKKVTIK